jgi:DNA-binding FadR family transcriptional regulator
MYEHRASSPQIFRQEFILPSSAGASCKKWRAWRHHYMTRPRADKDKAFNVIETTSRSGLVERQLREYIVGSRLVPGHRLPSENELSGRLGVSRSAIREGLKALEAVGVITTHQGKGSFVREFDSAAIADHLAISLRFDRPSLADILEVRKALETGFLSRAALLLTDEDFLALEEVVQRMRQKLKKISTFLSEDMEFHRLLYRKLDNRVLLSILEMFWKLFGQIEEGSEHSQSQLSLAVHQHQAILTALKKGDIGRAEQLLKLHFRDAERRIGQAGSKLVSAS